uniref:Anaphase-promoting complex subunit 1 n=1 Tax=Macrostomum lignano TaxID=282301 RepID=A0A1I8J1S9_9PLAT
IVDTRWGIQDTSTEELTATEICLEEAANCQQISMGPHFLTAREFIKWKIAQCQTDDQLDYSKPGSLSKELYDRYLTLNLVSSEMTFDDFASDPYYCLNFSMAFSASTMCHPVVILDRPKHPNRAVVLYIVDSVRDITGAFRRNAMSWPGQLVVCDTRDYRVLTISKTFDTGVLYLLEDGLHCITYRLKVFNIKTGELVRDLDPTNSIILKDMLVTPNRSLVVGKKFTPSDSANNEYHDPMKIVQAFKTTDGSMVFDYHFDEEPFRMLLPQNDRLAVLAVKNSVQRFEILSDISIEQLAANLENAAKSGHKKKVNNDKIRAKTVKFGQGHQVNSGQIETKLSQTKASKSTSAAAGVDASDQKGQKNEVQSYLKDDYTRFVRNVLSEGFAMVADARPDDPIDFLASWLRDYGQKHSC